MDNLKKYFKLHDKLWISEYDSMINDDKAEFILSFDVSQQTIPDLDNNSLLFIAIKYSINNNDDIANKIFETLIEHNIIGAAYNLGSYHIGEQNKKKSFSYFNKAIEQGDFHGYIGIGCTYYYANNYDKCLFNYEIALNKGTLTIPSYVYKQMGNIFATVNNYKGCEQYCEAAIKKGLNHGYYLLAQMFFDTSKYWCMLFRSQRYS